MRQGRPENKKANFARLSPASSLEEPSTLDYSVVANDHLVELFIRTFIFQRLRFIDIRRDAHAPLLLMMRFIFVGSLSRQLFVRAVMSSAMSSVVHKQVHQRTKEQQKIRKSS